MNEYNEALDLKDLKGESYVFAHTSQPTTLSRVIQHNNKRLNISTQRNKYSVETNLHQIIQTHITSLTRTT